MADRLVLTLRLEPRRVGPDAVLRACPPRRPVQGITRSVHYQVRLGSPPAEEDDDDDDDDDDRADAQYEPAGRRPRDVEATLRCAECDATFARKKTLKRHVLSAHQSEDVATPPPPTTPTKKKRKSRLTETQLAAVARARVVDGERVVFRCEQCGKSILHQFSYLTHLRIHTGEKPFTCHVCGRQFRTASQLVRHVNDVHEGIKRHACDVCGRMFAHARARNEHRRTHTEERPCVCHVCGKAFKTKASLYVHNTFHLDVFKHQCMHCERQFRRRQELNDHIMIHTGEKPFACKTCDKRFRQRQELKRHALTHSTEKPFECPVCKQCFSQKRYLRNHSKTHNV